MKTIGLIGGMSWESTAIYYKLLNEKISNYLGGLHSAKIILYSVDFAEIEQYQSSGDWDKSGAILGNIAKRLEIAGADFIVICTNTMHKVVDIIEKDINISIIHIGEATAKKIAEDGIKKVLLLGTKYTMEEDFYKNKIIKKGIEVVIPEKEDIEIINNIIFNELCVGEICQESKNKYLEIINKHKDIEGVILGCTEIGILVKQEDLNIPVYDTTLIHCIEAANFALE